MASVELIQEGKRQMKICNSCRYCEGYCAVWHAIEWRREFTEKDMTYLANLCHDCRECVFACPFTTPHEFGVNPPKLFAAIRQETYDTYAVKTPFGKLNFWLTALMAFLTFFGIVLGTHGLSELTHRHAGPGAFYQVLSEGLLTTFFSVLGFWMLLAWIVSAVRYWRNLKTTAARDVIAKDVVEAFKNAMRLRYLGKEAPEAQIPASRRVMHHFLFYGFLLDLASTTLGAIYSHILHIQAPYPITNPVVILGILGGIGIIIGAAGFIAIKFKNDPMATDLKAAKSGLAFSTSLLLIAVTGFLLLTVRSTPAMPFLLVVHLSTVASLFFTAPYSKFTHFVYRFLSLVRYAQEERTSAH